MTTTIKRRTFCCTKETEQQLEFLKVIKGETTSNIIKKSLDLYYESEKKKFDEQIIDLQLKHPEKIIFPSPYP